MFQSCRFQILSWLFLSSTSLLVVDVAQADKLSVRTEGERVWKSRNGTSTTAILTGFDSRVVQLERGDGTPLVVDREGLHADSEEFLKRLEKHPQRKVFAANMGCVVDSGLSDLPLIRMSIRVGNAKASDFEFLRSLTTLRGLFVEAQQNAMPVLENLGGLKDLESLTLFRQVIFGRGNSIDYRTEEVAQVGKLTGLRELSIRVSNRDAHHLSGLKKLRKLALDMATLGDAGLAQFVELKELEELSLGHTKVTNAGMVSVSELSKLKHLNLLYTRVDEDGLASLGKLPLESLKINSLVAPSGLSYFAKTNKLALVERTTSWQMRDVDLQVLSRLPTESLNLVGTEFSDIGMAYLPKFKKLKDVSFHRRDATDEDLRHFAGVQGLTRLSLVGRFDGSGMAHLAKMKSLEELHIISLTAMDPSSLKHLEGLTSLKKLELVFGRGVGSELSSLEKLAKLNSLAVKASELTSDGWKALSQLGQVAELTLGNGATDSGMSHVGRMTGLRKLDLQRSRVSDSGLQSLAALKQLRTLEMPESAVTDKGLRSVAGMTELEVLNLYRTRVSDEGVERLKGLKRLQRLNLQRSRVSGTGRRDLKEALPFVSIQ